MRRFEAVRRDQDYFNRVVRSQGEAVWVQARPRGSELRDLTDRVDMVNWFNILPGLISIVGWVLHHTVFRSRWLVTARHDVPQDVTPLLQLGPLPKREAERTFLELVDWLHAGNSLEAFRAPGGGPPTAE